MRKFFILVVCAITNHAIGANYNCTPIETGWINREFVYHLWGSANWTKQNPKQISLYCGHKEGGANGCPNGTFLITTNQNVVQCNSSGDNKWKYIDDNTIQNCDLKSKHVNYKQITNWKWNNVLFADINEIRIIEKDKPSEYQNNAFTTSNLNSVCKIAKSELDKLNQQNQTTETPQEKQTQKSGTDSEQVQLSFATPQTKAGDDCTGDQLPQYATAGKYINSGGKLKCAATACKNGTYLVVNASGASQGWCVAPSYCKNGTHLNIIENIKTDLKCVTDEPSSDSTPASDDGQSEVSGSDSGTTDETGESDTSTEAGTDSDGNNDVPDSDNGEELESSQSEQALVPTTPQDGTQCSSSDSHATAGIYKNGKCMPAVCADGYELSDDKCIEIGGDCDELPKNATASHRKYNPATRKVDCIVDSCAKNYKKSDDNLSCTQDLEAALESAKAKEQSLTARLTSGAAIGAMGIGGMQALSAVAEQNADADAEQDMKAYLATFRCDFGQGRNIQGGEKEIELPGANSLTQMVMEYTKLAEDLKVRKQALGMEPGIESEHVISAADTGLYDNAALGKTDGAYASLSRALTDKEGEDASEISAQKDKTAKKLKTGATVAGVGAAVGIAGNIAVEVTDKKEKNKGNK